ncbi:hypothetical protein LPJ64_004247 [Coemansia asiatica]|uniref:Zn(2)-C6 fungal-type domain-containing protein n=1 Tax=Coemansia asiatica TaxID=1052880 RepID=A0A9W7XIN8_9FUNG|nr:hypothetical protein LPJ64_004247 [Coemansia asiatica]
MAGSSMSQPPLPAVIPLLKSCESCRQRKIKCSGDKPTCTHCARRHQPCIYRKSARYKRRSNRAGNHNDIETNSSAVSVASTTATNRGSARAEPEKAVLNGVSASASATSAAGDFASAVVSAVANSSGTSLGNGRRVASTGLAPSLDSKLGMQMQPMEEATGVDENIPLSTLFNTRSMNEADILPPSILQSMNFWMNDSLLTGATTAAASISAGSSAIPAQAPVAMDIAQTMASAGLDGSQFSSISQAAFQQPQRQLSQQSQQSRVQELDILSNLIPMDIALGLPAFTSTQFAQVPAAIAQQKPQQNGIGEAAGLSALSGGLLPASLQQQQFNYQLGTLQIQPVAGTPVSAMGPAAPPGYPALGINSPLAIGSATPLFGGADMAATMMPFPTSAFASLNLVSSMDLQRSAQAIPGMQPTQSQPMSQTGGIGSEMAAMLGNPLVSPVMARAASDAASGSMRPVPAAPAAEIAESTAAAAADAPLRQNLALAGARMETLPRHNSMPVSRDSRFALPSLQVQTQPQPQPQAQPASISLSGSTSVVRAADSPLSLSMMQGGAQAESSAASAASMSPGPSVAQINSDAIPEAVRDIVAEYPALGSPELIYNLLITHVVHDCSRVGIYAARLFWMRVKQYELPRFYLLASIADACRSWTQSDAQRAAMPANLDETCYALAIQHSRAEAEAGPATVLNALGMLTLASYEFKSARFAAMVEHSCMAGKLMLQIKVRGAPFPWRGAERHADASGLDAHYQLYLRAYWRVYMGFFFATEIFRIDAPEDRDFLPEFPVRDDEFVRNEFEHDDNAELGFRMVPPRHAVPGCGSGDLLGIVCELFVRQYKIANLFNRVMRGEKTPLAYINYLREWDRQMLEWRRALPAYLRDDLPALARRTQPLDARRRRMDLAGLSEDAMWQRRHQWNQAVGSVMEILYVHMLFETARIKAHRIGLMILLHEDLDMVRNFQNSRAFAMHELPKNAGLSSVCGSEDDDAECFRQCARAADSAASHVYALLKFSYQFGFDLHAYTPVIIATLLQVGLVYVGQVQSADPRIAWNAMLRLARILGMIRSLDRWGPALYIFTNILKALGRPDLILHMPSPETRAQLAADTQRPEGAMDDDSDHPGHKRKGAEDVEPHGDEKRFEFGDHHHGTPQSSSATLSVDSPSISEDEDVTNPFPPDHVISHIMREQKVSTATFFSPTLPILAASLLHSNSGSPSAN